jgi:hypothetical protein
MQHARHHGYVSPLPPGPLDRARLEREVAARFPAQSGFRVIDKTTPQGSMPILLVWRGEPTVARALAWLPTPLSFDWEITPGEATANDHAAATSGTLEVFERLCRVQSVNPSAQQKMLESPELRALILEFMGISSHGQITASHVACDVVTPAVGSVGSEASEAVGRATRLAWRLFVRAQKLSLLWC